MTLSGRAVAQAPPERTPEATASPVPFRFTLRPGGSYNRVEGLPVMGGVRLARGGPAPFSGEVVGIWRSESTLRGDPARWGYRVSAEQRFGAERRLTFGASVGSVIAPIDASGLGTLEASLATLLLHEDHRDYLERRGVSAFLRYTVAPEGAVVTLEYRDEEHRYAPSRSPWTAWERDTPWRPQPLVGEGRVRTLGAELTFGGLGGEAEEERVRGRWEVRVATTFGVGGSLSLPAHGPDPTSRAPGNSIGVPDMALETGFATGTLEARRLHPLGAVWEVRLGGLVRGPLDGGPLPPQFQRALGGPGTLPAREVFALDCGARSSTYTLPRQASGGVAGPQRVYPSYGCDGVAFAQIELRRRLPIHLDQDPDDAAYEAWGWQRRPTLVPAAAVFLDAGRGWRASDDATTLTPTSTSGTLVDLGVGVFLGGAGIYWAIPLTETAAGSGGKLGVRLQRSF